MNILMIALHYHDYTRQIAEELRGLGHGVALHDIMPRTLANKTLRRVAPSRWQKGLDRHHRAILKEEGEKSYDMVLFIQVHQLSEENFAAFRQEFAGARFVLYNWDSIANHDYRPYLHAFDDVYTFDPEDARAYDLSYLPLFCSRTFQGLPCREPEKQAVYFVGNIVNPTRYIALDRFGAYCANHHIPFQSHAACTPPSLLAMLRGRIWPRGVRLGSIAEDRFLHMIETSVGTFDYANHQQAGYTMRVIENLCARRKIITNNGRIAFESFYSPDRIHIFEDFDFTGVRAFLDEPLERPEEDFPEYHIQAFVRHLVEGTSHSLAGTAACD